jgi:hypothetical protein
MPEANGYILLLCRNLYDENLQGIKTQYIFTAGWYKPVSIFSNPFPAKDYPKTIY